MQQNIISTRLLPILRQRNEQCKAAVEHGANIFVHTYNGMRGLHHREPGVVGAAITLKNVFDELICDGHHVHPVAAQVVMDGHGRDKTILVTDCMRGGGLGDSESMLGEFPVLIKDGAARLVSDGSLAGSVLELISAVRNVVSWGLATPAEAIKMASLVPAQSVGIADVCGQIAQGYAADFIVLDSNLELAENVFRWKIRLCESINKTEKEDDPMIGCIVTGHGEFAIGMTQALTMIAGDQEHYEVVPFYEENSLETFEDNIGKSIASLRENTDGVIIFTDLMGGTPFRTAMMQASEYDKVEVITGTNLPMLIEIGLGRIYSEDVEALAVQAVQVGMQGVQHPKLPVVADEKENESELEGI